MKLSMWRVVVVLNKYSKFWGKNSVLQLPFIVTRSSALSTVSGVNSSQRGFSIIGNYNGVQFLFIEIYKRLERVNDFPQFQEALMTDKKVLNLDEPMTLKDCAFLGSVYLPCGEDSTELDLKSLATTDIQDFAIVFKLLDGKNRYTISLPLLHNPLHS